ncbi:hypothetical protein FQA39_LY17120 [Lamprigera yunnana]|nr:hypothetical protein FQA39_LY17120 [Lamprigera yunnana]
MRENADEKFINAILQHPYLFGKRETKFKNISFKDTTWRNIGEPFHLSCEDAKTTLKPCEKNTFVSKEKVSRSGNEVSKPRKTIANTMKETVSKLQHSMDVYTVPVDEADAVYGEVIEVNSPSEIFLDVDDTITVEEISDSSLPLCSSDKSNNSHPHAPLGTIANTMKETVSKLQHSMDVYTVPVDEADAVYSEVIEVNSPSEIFLDVDDTITVEEISDSSLPSCSSDKSNNSHPHAPLGPKKRKTTEDRVCSAMEVMRISLIRLLASMATTLSKVPEVDIDPSGVFKYILLEAHGASVDDKKYLVRGYAICNYHVIDNFDLIAVDVNDLVTKELQKLKERGDLPKWSTKVLGGGRIIHDSSQKSIKVYGYSQAYGKADHATTVELLRKVYDDYDITWSDEGY